MKENIRENRNDRKAKIVFFIIFAIFIMMFIFWVIHMLNMSRFKVREDKIVREISDWDVLFLKSAPTDRNVTWHQETLPSFIQKDMEYAKKNNYDIKYIFEDNIRIELYYNYEYEEWWLYIRNPRVSYITGEFTIADFSIYKKDDNIEIYGYDATYRRYFGKVLITKDSAKFTALTYDSNLPFDMKDESLGINRIGEYSLVIKEDENKFSFYKDGNFISSQEFSEGKIAQVNQYDGFLFTNKDQLYVMYAELKDGMPTIKFVYAGQADGSLGTGYNNYLSCADEDMHMRLPIMIREGKYYVVVPEDWETMETLGFRNAELDAEEISSPNYSVKLVELEKSFKDASFTYNAIGIWYATLKFEFNGVDFFIEYQFGGYDDSVELPDALVSKYISTKVKSIDELWEHIEDLRIEYFDYYDHKGG